MDRPDVRREHILFEFHHDLLRLISGNVLTRPILTSTALLLKSKFHIFAPLCASQDKFGSKICGAVAVAVGSGAVVMLGFGGSNGYFWLAALFLLGGFNVCVFMCVISLAKTMPATGPWFISFCLGLFDMSAIVFLGFRMLRFDAGLEFQSICIGYAIISACVGCLVIPLLPRAEDSLEIQNEFDAFHEDDGKTKHGTYEAVGGADEAVEAAAAAGSPVQAAEESVNPEEEFLCFHATSTSYIGMTVFMTVFNLKNTFFVATFSEQMLALHENGVMTADQMKKLNLVFNFIFPLGGAAVVPFSGWFLSKFRARQDAGFWLVLAIGLVHGTLNLIPSLAAQYAAVLCFAMLRSLKVHTGTLLILRPLSHLSPTHAYTSGLYSTIW